MKNKIEIIDLKCEIKKDVDPMTLFHWHERLNPKPEFSYCQKLQSEKNHELERIMREKFKEKKK